MRPGLYEGENLGILIKVLLSKFFCYREPRHSHQVFVVKVFVIENLGILIRDGVKVFVKENLGIIIRVLLSKFLL